jgi:hypothetical protein
VIHEDEFGHGVRIVLDETGDEKEKCPADKE